MLGWGGQEQYCVPFKGFFGYDGRRPVGLCQLWAEDGCWSNTPFPPHPWFFGILYTSFGAQRVVGDNHFQTQEAVELISYKLTVWKEQNFMLLMSGP